MYHILIRNFDPWFAMYVILGTTISPWIVTLDALEPFACQAPTQVLLRFCICTVIVVNVEVLIFFLNMGDTYRIQSHCLT
jgi:hypothetical protein